MIPMSMIYYFDRSVVIVTLMTHTEACVMVQQLFSVSVICTSLPDLCINGVHLVKNKQKIFCASTSSYLPSLQSMGRDLLSTP